MAVGLVGVRRLVASGHIRPEASVVAALTGSDHRETHVLAGRSGFQVEQLLSHDGLEALAETCGAGAGVEA